MYAPDLPGGAESAGRPALTGTRLGNGVRLAPAPRARVDPLVCEVTPAAVAAGQVHRFHWTVDGEPFEGLTLTTRHPGDTVFPGYTRPGQQWACTVDAEVVTGMAVTTVIEADPEALDPVIEPVAWIDHEVVHYDGELADERDLYVEYGYDGWSERSAPPGARSTLTEWNDSVWWSTATLTKVHGQVVVPLDIPEGVRTVHMKFRAGDLVDDDDGLEYHWDLEFPAVGPYLTWNDAARPTDGVVVNWASGQPGLGIVEYGPDEENVAWVVGEVVDTLHHVALTGLPADTEFVYRVRDATERVSPWSRFRTAAEGEDTFTFLIASDMQDAGLREDRWADVAADMAEGWPDARFVLAPGDLAANDRPGLWWLFFDGGRELFDHVPLVPTIGNHDTPEIASNSDSTSYSRWFEVPRTDGHENWYRLDYGTTRVYSISTEVPETLEETGAQRAWLRDEMSALWENGERSVDWAVAGFHRPAYDAGKRFTHEGDVLRPFTEEFDGNVDLVIQAHEHIYQRFHPLRYDAELAPSGEYGLGPDDGVCYVVTPAAGFSYLNEEMAKEEDAEELYAALAFPVMEGGEDRDHTDGVDDDYPTVEPEHGFLVAEVSPSRLVLTSYATGTPEAPSAPRILDETRIER